MDDDHKKCTDCKYHNVHLDYRNEIPLSYNMCIRLKRIKRVLNPVTGYQYVGKEILCYKARKKEKFCGKQGRWFKSLNIALPPESE